jgi:hypothetical protein
MVDRLRAVVEEAEKLSDEDQEALAAILEEALAEREWEMIVRKPRVRDALKRMAQEALEEDATGETEEITGDTFA